MFWVNSRVSSFIVILFMSLFFVTAAAADPFVGEFAAYADDDNYSIKMNAPVNGYYHGTMSVDGEIMPLTANKSGKFLVGTINDYGDVYQFTAVSRADGSFVFTDEDGESIVFRPKGQSRAGGEAPAGPDYYSQQGGTAQQSDSGAVYINRKKLSPDKRNALESAYQTRIQSGRYWYDNICGAWGVEGGPTTGFILAGLDLPGPMPADISKGGTGIFINGREIHPMDQRGLQQLFGVTYKGNYWLDAQGNLGPVGGYAIVNIVNAIQAAQQQQSSGSVTHGYGSSYGSRGTLSSGGMYSGRTASGKSVFWYPGK
ncbi:hypothetical protein [Psychromonas aquimarina]|uniref:hypothetical protein n=1 Tax=Psychromonas aquimarina TaxID=444919 RepID=UPI00040691EC|nr:hypothetical protein [Psychromonas aquimarina]